MVPGAEDSLPGRTRPKLPGFRDFLCTPYDRYFWKQAVQPSQSFFPVVERFLFSGRSGPPPSMRLGWSLGFPGNFGKETDRNETCFFYKPPPGPRRRYGPK